MQSPKNPLITMKRNHQLMHLQTPAHSFTPSENPPSENPPVLKYSHDQNKFQIDVNDSALTHG